VALDTTGVHIRGGEFVEKELQAAVNKEETTRRALYECLEFGSDRAKWLVFSSGIAHAESITRNLQELGVSALAVHSKMNGSRDAAINAFKEGKIQALVNSDILTTGFDEPGIDLIACFRPTMSSRLWVQMLGRGTRPNYASGFNLSEYEDRLQAIRQSSKQNCLVMDFARNIEKMGPINDPVVPRKKGKGGSAPAPVKVCTGCGNYNHASARYCGGKAVTHDHFDPNAGCGQEFLFQNKLVEQASSKELVKATDIPILETFRVDHITYRLHRKIESPSMMKATYYCGVNVFHDYVCLDHPATSYPHKKARDWWRTRSKQPIPQSVDEALDRTQELGAPTHLSVLINRKYPEIRGYCFDGSAFGTITIEDPLTLVAPSVDTSHERSSAMDSAISGDKLSSVNFDDMDDDIPF
jgi:DNA repair protein RadD